MAGVFLFSNGGVVDSWSPLQGRLRSAVLADQPHLWEGHVSRARRSRRRRKVARPLPAFQRERDKLFVGCCSGKCLQGIRRLDVVRQGLFFFFLETLTLLFSYFDKHKTTSSTTKQDSPSEVPPPLASLSEEEAVFLHGIQLYRQGRQLLEGKQEFIDDSKMDADNAQELKAAWEAFDPLKPGHHADLEGKIANIGSAVAKEIIAEEAVIGLHAAVFKSFGEQDSYLVSRGQVAVEEADRTPWLMASKLLETMTELHGLHDNHTLIVDYRTLIVFGTLMMDLTRVADVPEGQAIDEKLLMNVLTSVKKFSTSDEVLARCLPEKAKDIVTLVKDVETSPVFQRCLLQALKEVESELEGIKHLAVHMEHQSLFDPSDELRMRKLSELVIPDGMVLLFNKLRSLPNANVMLAECLYLHSLAVLLKSVATLGLERSRATARKDRHVTQLLVDKIIGLRGYTFTMKQTVEQGLDGLFFSKNAKDLVAMLTVDSATRRLQVPFDTASTLNTIAMSESLVTSIADGWHQDISDLGAAMSPWMVQGLRVKLASLLDTENKGT